MKSRNLIVALLVLLLPAVAFAGQSHFLNGNFGQVGMEKANLNGAMNGIMSAQFDAPGDFKAYRTSQSELGSHVRFQQYLNDMPVFGAQMMLHVDRNGNAYSVNGGFGDDTGAVTPKIDGGNAMAMALGKAGIASKVFAQPELGYLLVDGKAVLVWHAMVEYANEVGPQRDRVFASAADGTLVARFPEIHFARSLQTYNCNNGTACSSLVSSSSNAINTGDLAIDAAHNFAIDTYNYYFDNYGRDSLNNAGMTLKSRVHYNSNYNNAFWDGSQMTYGDGDGTTFIPLSRDADVVAHELSHGVTSFESNLTYSYESGALNEAFSDIIGSEVDRYYGGATGNAIWQVGEDIYTPGTPGDALRNMADPASEGDYDCYPTRYTGSSDNGGVHWNSGISNLAFKLLSTGGSHPRSCSCPNGVTAIGNVKAAKIFYEANANCAVASTNFEGWRNCTASKAAALYGAAEEAAIHEAWDCVQVPGGPNAPPPPPPPPPGSGCTDTNIWTGTLSSGALVTPNCSASGTFNGVLECPVGSGSVDLDLYLQKSGWLGWSDVAVGGTANCEETVSGYNGTSGTYRWYVDHYSGGTAEIRLCTNKC